MLCSFPEGLCNVHIWSISPIYRQCRLPVLMNHRCGGAAFKFGFHSGVESKQGGRLNPAFVSRQPKSFRHPYTVCSMATLKTVRISLCFWSMATQKLNITVKAFVSRQPKAFFAALICNAWWVSRSFPMGGKHLSSANQHPIPSLAHIIFCWIKNSMVLWQFGWEFPLMGLNMPDLTVWRSSYFS